MLSSTFLNKPATVVLFLGLASLNAYAQGELKFGINESGKIYLTKEGRSFVTNVASRQVNGRLKLVTKKQAYEWMDRFIKLSNKDAQKREDFTPVNNLYRHLALCDEILGELILESGEVQNVLTDDEKIPAKRKEKLMAELNNLRGKLREDIKELVTGNSQPSMKILVDFYDKALKETLDIN